MLRNAVALAALTCAGGAVAQTSNCMNIGGGMVHCDTIGPSGSMSSTDCTNIGSGMTTCNTVGGQQSQRSDLRPASPSGVTEDSPIPIREPYGRAAQPVPPFNLLCEGIETQFTKAGAQDIPFTRIFRINLNLSRYCEGDCTTTRAIAQVEPTRITLFDNIGPNGIGGEQSINRENGELNGSSMSVGGMPRFVKAQCQRQPFSGFPAQRF